jgi:cell division ATPase FtsA
MWKLPFNLNLGGLKKSNPKDTFFTIDIGSNSVKALTFKLDKEQSILQLVGTGIEHLEPNVVRAGNIIEVETGVVPALDSALFSATEGLDEEITDAIFGVGADLCTCLMTSVRINRGTTEPISKKELDNINSKILESSYTRAQDKVTKSTGNLEPDIEMISKSVVYAKLDDKFRNQLEGQTAQKIELAIFTAYVPAYHLKALQNIAKLLKLNILAIVPNMYALGQMLKLANKNNRMDSIIIDIGSDTTEVGIMFGGGMVTTKVLSLGGNQFTRHLSDYTGLSISEANNKKHEYTFGNLPDDEIGRIESGLTEAGNLWLSGMEILFADFTGVKTFPTEIFLTGGGSKLPLVDELLENKPWTKSIPFREPPLFNKIGAKDLKHIYDTTGIADQEEFIVPMCLSVAFLEMRGLVND